MQTDGADTSDRLMVETSGVDPKRGPLDCDGGCDGDCEGRHLDHVEKTRWEADSGFRYPRQPLLVITASRDLSRTASTWGFNAVRLLFRQAKEACDSYWVRALSKEKLEQRLSTGAHVVVKTHEWTDHITPAEFEGLSPKFSNVVVSVRKGFTSDPEWMKVATHVLNFEEVTAYDADSGEVGAIAVLRGLADHLGLTGLTDYDIRAVDYYLMTMSMPTGTVDLNAKPDPTGLKPDPVTKLWPFHGRRGGRPVPAAPTPPMPP